MMHAVLLADSLFVGGSLFVIILLVIVLYLILRKG